MVTDDAARVSALLRRWVAGDRAAFDALLPLLYDELRRVARGCLRGERRDHTLRPTELVAEVYERLVCSEPDRRLSDQAHFRAIAARAMRQVLIDHARRRNAAKRGGGVAPVPLTEEPSTSRPSVLEELEAALQELETLDERKARVVELHYYGGLSQVEIAGLLGTHVNTTARDLRFAQAFLHQRLLEAA